MSQLEYIRGQFQIAQMYAMYWHAMAVTGAATWRKISKGREPTDAEKASGMCIGWSELSDQEKAQEALSTMERHIHRMHELNELIHRLESEQES